MLWFKSRYRHETLDKDRQQIRLLRLRSELSEDGLIQCELSTHDLAAAPSYQAISYEWGPPKPVQRVRIAARTIRIRRNLWLFLDMFRSNAANDTLLWIDQLCINQQDITERGHQVKLMGKIYTRAMRAVVWLGPSTGVNTDIRTTLERHGHLFSMTAKDIRAENMRAEGKSPNWTANRTSDEWDDVNYGRPPSNQICTDGKCALCY